MQDDSILSSTTDGDFTPSTSVTNSFLSMYIDDEIGKSLLSFLFSTEDVMLGSFIHS